MYTSHIQYIYMAIYIYISVSAVPILLTPGPLRTPQRAPGVPGPHRLRLPLGPVAAPTADADSNGTEIQAEVAGSSATG
jgi:hypothetical protein